MARTLHAKSLYPINVYVGAVLMFAAPIATWYERIVPPLRGSAAHWAVAVVQTAIDTNGRPPPAQVEVWYRLHVKGNAVVHVRKELTPAESRMVTQGVAAVVPQS